MAARACASAEAVTVQVFTTMMSAVAEVGAEVQPRSSNWRSRAAPSACVARQPNCWMKKLGIWNHGIEPKTTYAGFAEYTESTEKKRLDPLLSTNPCSVRTHARTPPAAVDCCTRIAGLEECEKTDSNKGQYWGSRAP